MKFFKKALVGVAIASTLATTAYAAPITVAGVTWDPSYIFDLQGFSSRIRQFAAPDGSLSGFGYISELNNSAMFGGTYQLMPVGQELTFTFGGFQLTPLSVTPTASGQFAAYQSGWLKIWADDGTGGAGTLVTPNDITTYNFGNTSNGTLFLDLLAHTNSLTGLTLSVSTTGSGGNGSGSFDVIGGAAAGNFNTNQTFDGADIDFNSSFSQRFGNPNPYTDLVGNANFIGKTVPEPESLALVGLGLLGLAVSRRRKSSN